MNEWLIDSLWEYFSKYEIFVENMWIIMKNDGKKKFIKINQILSIFCYVMVKVLLTWAGDTLGSFFGQFSSFLFWEFDWGVFF